MAEVAVKMAEKTDLPALEILDIACEPYRGCDADFDGSYYHDEPFGQLLQRAFQPKADYDPTADEDGDWWWEHVVEPFKKRFGLW